MIRSYRQKDAAILASIHTAVFPDDPLSPHAFDDNVVAMRAAGAIAWVIEDGTPFGFALAVPVPGLPHIAELKGFIAPARQRRGFGSRLLQRVLADLQPGPVRQVSHQVHDMNSPAADFLRKRGFVVEHDEWFLIRHDLLNLPQPRHETQVTAVTYPQAIAVAYFYQLFKDSFSEHPWYQPFSKQEIADSLADARSIIFLEHDLRPIAFAWLHLHAGGLGVIEPLGVLPQFQNRGFGRYLLLSALHNLARRGATRAQIGAWRTNQPAIHLYQSLGFKHHETITFLAYNLD